MGIWPGSYGRDIVPRVRFGSPCRHPAHLRPEIARALSGQLAWVRSRTRKRDVHSADGLDRPACPDVLFAAAVAGCGPPSGSRGGSHAAGHPGSRRCRRHSCRAGVRCSASRSGVPPLQDTVPVPSVSFDGHRSARKAVSSGTRRAREDWVWAQHHRDRGPLAVLEEAR